MRVPRGQNFTREPNYFARAAQPQKNMAALRDDRSREMLNFKSFAARKKAEYALRFPFLTDRQILAKLRRVWKAASAARRDLGK